MGPLEMSPYLWLAMEEAGDAMEADVLINNRHRRERDADNISIKLHIFSFSINPPRCRSSSISRQAIIA